MSTAVEHLAKAVLCEVHPALILDHKHPKYFEALLHAARHPSSTMPLTAMRTISCAEALTRARRLDARVPSEDECRSLIQARDGLIHLGVQASGATSGLVALGVRVCAALLRSLDATDFWGGFSPSVATVLDEHATEVQRVVAIRLHAAVERLRSQHVDMGEVERNAIFTAIAEAHEPYDAADNEVGEVCPACGFEGLLAGDSELREGEPDWDYADGQAYLAGLPVSLWLTAECFRCFVCDLHLTTHDQLAAAKLPLEVEMRAATDEDLRGFYGYDEDRW